MAKKKKNTIEQVIETIKEKANSSVYVRDVMDGVILDTPLPEENKGVCTIPNLGGVEYSCIACKWALKSNNILYCRYNPKHELTDNDNYCSKFEEE